MTDISDALVAAAYEAAARETSNWSTQAAPEAIRALTPSDARTALDRMVQEAVKAEREACAVMVEDWQAYTLYGRERISGEMAAEIRNRENTHDTD